MSDQRFPLAHGYKGARRDRFIAGIASWIVSTFASRGYNNFLLDIMIHGRFGVIKRLRAERERREADE